jgi:hypothetical protein
MTKVGEPTPPLIPDPEPIYNEVSMTFRGVCPDRTDFEVRPSVYIYFKITGAANAFQYLG